ncbi:DUF397 domain-containing protein [Actinoplanes sp. G11-F43]|uniref:DUF397 domain-containing protein n=1 Tax=Actinoplanes sp. G11-F43 TaxID=3424130 RepID=UPI003D32D802
MISNANDSFGPQWRKSTRSGATACVEVAHVNDRVMVRDSKNPDGTVLSFGRSDWDAFLDVVSAGAPD